jgi:hypothetical protein
VWPPWGEGNFGPAHPPPRGGHTGPPLQRKASLQGRRRYGISGQRFTCMQTKLQSGMPQG